MSRRRISLLHIRAARMGYKLDVACSMRVLTPGFGAHGTFFWLFVLAVPFEFMGYYYYYRKRRRARE